MKKLLLIFLIFATTTACSGIPNSSSIKYGSEIKDSETDQFIQVIGRPPVDGMNESQIISGFLGALADTRNDYAVAKQYLSEDAAQVWRPKTGITIYDSASLEVAIQGESAVIKFAKFGDLDSSGYLNLSAPTAQESRNLSLEKNNQGQWRISQIDDGVLLTTSDVDRGFIGFPIYFLSPDRKSLVADTVLFPQTFTGSATALIQALLDGPSSKLALATINSFPSGTKLTYGSVPIEDGIATVDLTNQILSADQSTRAQLSAQIAWTLSSVPSVTGIKIEVSGQPFLVSGLPEIQSPANWPTFNPTHFSGSELVHFVKANQVVSINLDGQETPVVQVDPNVRIQIGRAEGAIDGGSIAAISSDSKQVLLSTGRGGQFELVDRGEALSKPSWDKSGSIFYSDYGVGIFEFNSKRQKRTVEFDSTNFARTNQVKQISVARDGIRVVMVISDGSRDFLLGGSLLKSENLTQIIGLHLIERSISGILDLTWQTPTSIAVLGSDGSGGNLIFDVDLETGTSSSIPAPLNAQTLASSIAKQLYVGTVNGSKLMVAKQSGSIWTDFSEGSSPYLAK